MFFSSAVCSAFISGAFTPLKSFCSFCSFPAASMAVTFNNACPCFGVIFTFISFLFWEFFSKFVVFTSSPSQLYLSVAICVSSVAVISIFPFLTSIVIWGFVISLPFSFVNSLTIFSFVLLTSSTETLKVFFPFGISIPFSSILFLPSPCITFSVEISSFHEYATFCIWLIASTFISTFVSSCWVTFITICFCSAICFAFCSLFLFIVIRAYAPIPIARIISINAKIFIAIFDFLFDLSPEFIPDIFFIS